MRGGLRTKLVLSHLGLVLLSMIVLAFYLVRNMEWLYLTTVQSSMRDEVDLLADRMAPDLAAGNRDAVAAYLKSINPHVAANVLVADADGVIIASTDPGESPLIGRPGASRGLIRGVQRRIEQIILGADQPNADMVYIVEPVQWEGRQVGSMRVSLRLGSLYAQLAGLTSAILLGLAAATGVGLLVSLVLAHSLSAPARGLAAAARALSSGDLDYRIRPSGRDEIQEAGRAFDALADQLQHLERERQQLLGDVAHDLHSSITGVSMAVETLQRGAVDDPDMRSLLLDGLASHSRRLHRMADDLLETARMEAGRLTLQKSTVDPNALLRSVAAEFAAEAAERRVILQVENGEDAPPLWADPERLGQALGNLVENAIRHVPEGGKVAMKWAAHEEECWLSVSDEGPGISEQELPKLFDRFNRFLEGRPGRLGFGLAIAKGLVEAHGGRVVVTSATGTGTVFTIALPVEKGA